MARYAIISDSQVVNLVEWDGDTTRWQPPSGTTTILVPDGVRVSSGDTWDGVNFIEPPPRPLTRREELARTPVLTAPEIQEALKLLLEGP